MDNWTRFLLLLRDELAAVPAPPERVVATLKDRDWQAAMNYLDPECPSCVRTPAEAYEWFERGLAAIRRHSK